MTANTVTLRHADYVELLRTNSQKFAIRAWEEITSIQDHYAEKKKAVAAMSRFQKWWGSVDEEFMESYYREEIEKVRRRIKASGNELEHWQKQTNLVLEVTISISRYENLLTGKAEPSYTFY